MARKATPLDDVLDIARELGEWIGNQLYHGWQIDDYSRMRWEEMLDGTYAEQEGFPDYEEQIAEAASHARHCAYHTHDVASCDRHVAEYVMSQFDDEVEFASH